MQSRALARLGRWAAGRRALVVLLAGFGMGLTFEEALVASTLNAAHALDRADRVGSLEPGKQCDAVLVAGPAVDLLRIGGTSIHAVIKAGRVVHSGP